MGLYGQQVLQRLEDMAQPVIAAVNGFALGGGLQVALACDFRYAAPNAVFRAAGSRVGDLCRLRRKPRLVRAVGGNSEELLYTAEFISAEEAL